MKVSTLNVFNFIFAIVVLFTLFQETSASALKVRHDDDDKWPKPWPKPDGKPWPKPDDKKWPKPSPSKWWPGPTPKPKPHCKWGQQLTCCQTFCSVNDPPAKKTIDALDIKGDWKDDFVGLTCEPFDPWRKKEECHGVLLCCEDDNPWDGVIDFTCFPVFKD